MNCSSLLPDKAEIRHHQKSNLKKSCLFGFWKMESTRFSMISIWLTSFWFGYRDFTRVLENDSWSQAYLRGAFLASGSVTQDPEKGKYQLEIASVYSDHAYDLANLMQKFLLDAKVIERSKGTITYLQRAEDIMDFLLVIGAEDAKTEFENSEIVRGKPGMI